MKNESVKKSLEKSKNVLEEKRKTVKRKICIKKTHTFTIIAMNCVQEQLKIGQAKNRIKKKTDRTNIIATNFVWAQLNNLSLLNFKRSVIQLVIFLSK